MVFSMLLNSSNMFSARALLAFASLTTSALGATYSQTESYVGSQFLSGFQHMAIADPTHGRVYVPSLYFPDPTRPG